MKLLESIDFGDRADFVIGVLKRGQDVDAVLYAVGDLEPMDTVLLLAQVTNACPPELQDRVYAFIEEAGERYLPSAVE